MMVKALEIARTTGLFRQVSAGPSRSTPPPAPARDHDSHEHCL